MLTVQRRTLLNQPLDTVPLTFTRPSVAYTWDGKPLPPNTPRFEQLINGKVERGYLNEEEHTNEYSASQSQSPRFTALGITPATIINESNEYKLFGENSCKVTFNTISSSYDDSLLSPQYLLNHPAGATKTYQTWIYSETALNLTMRITGDTYLGEKVLNITPGLNHCYMAVKNNEAVDKVLGMYFYQASELATIHICGAQILSKDYPLSWVLGGTSQEAETLLAPGSVLNPYEGTIEIEIYVKNENKGKYIFFAYSGNNNILLYQKADNNFFFWMWDAVHYTEIDTDVISEGLHKFTLTYDTNSMEIFVDGILMNYTEAPPLPQLIETIILGRYSGGGYNSNTLFLNLILSKHKRSHSELTARASLPEGQAPRPDRDTMLYAPLMHDLRAWRVRA